MIFTDRLLFLHIQKTAGMSLTHALLSSLKKPVYNIKPVGDKEDGQYGETVIDGMRHENLYQANEFFDNNGFDKTVDSFERIIVIVRNPYDLEVSRYSYLRNGYPWNKGRDAEIAVKSNFREFALTAPVWYDIKDYIIKDGMFLDNLRVVRFETFATEIKYLLKDYLENSLVIKRINKSKRKKDFRLYMDAEVEESIYQKYKFLFDYGFYPRMRKFEKASSIRLQNTVNYFLDKTILK